MVALRACVVMGLILAIPSPFAGANVFNMPSGQTSIVMVPVGSPGNAADPVHSNPGSGAVAYTYSIDKYDVTVAQYVQFLNAVAATDTYGVASGVVGNGLVQRSGTSGGYIYAVSGSVANQPVRYVTLWNTVRFANWLANGQPVGQQDAATTEDGSYTLGGYTGSDVANHLIRNPGATWALTSPDEWYKAAYFDPNKPVGAGYWGFATKTDSMPTGQAPPGGSNSANYGNAVGTVTNVGAYTNSLSAFGTYDQNGNVWQWNERSAICGGAFTAYGTNGVGAGSAFGMTGHDPTNGSSTIGFRVVQLAPSTPVPLPGAAYAGLVGLAGLGVVGLARKRTGNLKQHGVSSV